MWYVSIHTGDNYIERIKSPVPLARAINFLIDNKIDYRLIQWKEEEAFNNNMPPWKMVRHHSKNVVYFIHAIGSGRVKIGWAKDLLSRMHSFTCDSPFPVEVLTTFPGVPSDELIYHQMFADYRVHNEWFLYNEQLREFIEQNRTKD